MDWSRVPIVKAAIHAAEGIRIIACAVFVETPLYLIGFRKCNTCRKRISPKEEMETTKYNYHGWEETKHYCEKCSDSRYKGFNTKEE